MKRTLLFLAILIVFAMSIGVIVAQDDIPRGGTVRINQAPQASWVRNFNPFAPDPAHPTVAMIYEPLVLFNPVDGGAPTYWLAENYAYSEDLLSLTYNIRQGVKWSDGEDFDADDVVFTFEMIQAFPALDRSGLLPFTDSIVKVDDFTVQFNLKEVYTQADTVIGGLNIVPEHIWATIEDPVTFTNPEPVATGPFTEVVNFSEQVYDVCRNPYYWQEGRPYVDCLRYPVYSGAETVNLALINDELDWTGNFVADIEQTYVAVDPEDHAYYFWPGGAAVQLYFNTTVSPFSDVNFRRAMSQAIDYDSVVNIGMYGYTIQANPTGIGPSHESWVSQAALDRAAELGLGTYNPDAARATLDAAGYVDTNGDGFREAPDGSEIVFPIQVVTGWNDWVTSVQIMAQNLQDIGINASMSSLDFGEWFSNLQNGSYSASIGWSTVGRTPWDFYRNVLDSTLIGADGVANGQTWGRWTNEEATALLNAFTSTADEAEQRDIINQLQMFYVENSPAIPLFPGPTWYEYNTTRFTGFPTPENYYAQGSPWALTSRLIVAINIHCEDAAACE